MKKSKGFTLIELVVVIVIIGILSATAAPRFLNLQDDARHSVMKGVKGSLTGGVNIAYGKMAANGLETKPYTGEPSGIEPGYPDLTDIFPSCTTKECAFRFGYPNANRESLSMVVSGIGDGEALNFADMDEPLVEIDGQYAQQIAIAATEDVKDGKLIDDRCYVSYASWMTIDRQPLIKVIGCK